MGQEVTNKEELCCIIFHWHFHLARRSMSPGRTQKEGGGPLPQPCYIPPRRCPLAASSSIGELLLLPRGEATIMCRIGYSESASALVSVSHKPRCGSLDPAGTVGG